MTLPRPFQTLAGVLALGIAAGGALASPGPSGPDARRIVDAGVVSQGVPACRSCHGARGEGVTVQNGPRLAHLDADYLQGQLDAFATGARRHPVMEPIARALTPDQRAALGAYFAGLPPAAPSTAASASGSELSAGRALALGGDWSRGVPPCASCHGPDGQGVGSVTPPLVGQTGDYLLRQLTAFRAGDRKSALGLMNGIARRLSPTQLRAVAAYYATVRPAAAAPSRTR